MCSQCVYDVIVVGGGPGGLPAAIAASRMGKKTLLVERSAFLGGLACSGLPLLGYVDRAGNQVLGGIAQEFIDRLDGVGATLGHIRCPIHNSITPINPHWFRIVAFEMCREAGVDVELYADLLDVRVDQRRVCGIVVACRGELKTFEGKMFIDATGDGTLACKAGARYEKNERLQPASLTFTLGGVDIDAVRDYVANHPETTVLPDTYGMRQTPEQFTNPRGFTLTGYAEFIEQARQSGEFTLPRDRVIFTTLPDKGEVMVNTTRVLGVDSSKDDLSEAESECYRQVGELTRFLKKYAPGFAHSYLSSISTGIGSRESRRIVGIKTLDSGALEQGDIPQDTVVLAGYNVDIHVPDTQKLYLQPVAHAIGIPYGCLVSADIPNLMMSGRCISVSGDIYGLTRIMGTCLACGEAAGTAAALALAADVDPAQVDVRQLRARLVQQGGYVSI